MVKQLIMQSDKHYTAWIGEVCRRFKQSQIKASIKVNTELLRFYFTLGRDLHIMKEQFGAGNEFYSTASKDLSKALPDVKSFSPTNLKYMQYFFELYSCKRLNIIGQQIVAPNNAPSPQLVDRNNGISPQVVDDLTVSIGPQVADDFENTDIKSTLPSIEEIEAELNHSRPIISKIEKKLMKLNSRRLKFASHFFLCVSCLKLKPPFSVEHCLSIGLRHVRRSLGEGGSRPCEG